MNITHPVWLKVARLIAEVGGRGMKPYRIYMSASDYDDAVGTISGKWYEVNCKYRGIWVVPTTSTIDGEPIIGVKTC